jgi:hypothetical protein
MRHRRALLTVRRHLRETGLRTSATSWSASHFSKVVESTDLLGASFGESPMCEESCKDESLIEAKNGAVKKKSNLRG